MRKCCKKKLGKIKYYRLAIIKMPRTTVNKSIKKMDFKIFPENN